MIDPATAPDGPRAVLVGAPGAGKTTVGRALARAWDVEFLDTDEVIARRFGKPVPEIFVEDGEPAFRAAEAQAVLDALEQHHGVVSLGGGAILDPQTRAELVDHPVVWLRVSASSAAARVGLTGARPLLMGNVRGTLITLLQERTPWYQEVATVSVETDHRSIPEIVAEIREQLGAV
jgi:shikimate kinase